MVEDAKTVNTPKKALIYLENEAKKYDVKMAVVIFKSKINNSYKQNFAGLSQFDRDLLTKTYAWLMKIAIDDEDILKLNKEGLKKMILYRIAQITTDICRSCTKMVHYSREEEYLVSCWECGRGACNECYPCDISGGKSWRYLCEPCIDTIGKLSLGGTS